MKLKSAIATVIVTGMMVAGCKKEEAPTPSLHGLEYSQSEKQAPIVLDEFSVGEYHNQKLDEIFDKLQARIQGLGYQSLRKYHFRNVYSATLNETFMGSQNEQFRQLGLKMYDAGVAAPSLDDQFHRNLATIRGSSASRVFKDFTTGFLATARKKLSQEDADGFCFECYQKLARQKLKGTELKIALGAISVYQSSFQYWTLNDENWRTLIHPGDGTPVSTGSGPVGGGEDAGGVVVRALSGAAGGTATLPGVGTVGGWLTGGVAGGVGNSLRAAFADLWDWLGL
jgi:hypothetical protein